MAEDEADLDVFGLQHLKAAPDQSRSDTSAVQFGQHAYRGKPGTFQNHTIGFNLHPAEQCMADNLAVRFGNQRHQRIAIGMDRADQIGFALMAECGAGKGGTVDGIDYIKIGGSDRADDHASSDGFTLTFRYLTCSLPIQVRKAR